MASDKRQKPKVVIYTDGACLNNPGPGGYAALLIFKSDKVHEKVISGGQKISTNNQMELKAVIESLKSLKTSCDVQIFTDSKYVILGITAWIKSWEKNGFKNAKNKDVLNKELWIELNDLAGKHNISWHWVKGHSGDKHNEMVDQIAKQEAMNITY